MKILSSRVLQFNPFGQILTFEDGTIEFDLGCTQTTSILTAELYNGKAAKTKSGEWVPAPGMRNHEWEEDVLKFTVGLTMLGIDGDGKAIWDYSVCTPMGVWFHGDGKDNTLHAPSSWRNDRVALEIVSWMCLGEDAGIEFSRNTTDEQWVWIRSAEREYLSAEVDELMQSYDSESSVRVGNPENIVTNAPLPIEDPQPPTSIDARIDELANLYLDRYVFQCQTAIINYVLAQESGYIERPFSWEDITNLELDADAMDGKAAADYINDVLGDNWRDLIVGKYFDSDGQPVEDVDPDDLDSDDVAILREYVRDHAEPREIYEWWLVDEWLAEQLEEIDEPTVTDGQCYWWGRGCTGQMIIMDGTLQKIAAKYAEMGL